MHYVFLRPWSSPGPGHDALCLYGGEEEGRSQACLCGPCWAPGLGAAAEAEPGLPRPTEGGPYAGSGGGHLHSGGLAWAGLWNGERCQH